MKLDGQARIVVAGAGSVGCYLGGCLARAGRRVTLLLRPALGEAIARDGLRITDLDGADHLLAPASIPVMTDAAAALAQADVILVTVKSGATAEMAERIGRHAPPGAAIVSLQNGVGNAETIGARVDPGHPVVPGMVPFNVRQMPADDGGGAPRFHRATSGALRIAPGVQGLRELLDVPGAAVAEHPNMAAVLWGKLLMNLNNALNALSGMPLAAQLSDRHWRVLLAVQVSEALSVLRAAGVRPARVGGAPPQLVPLILRLPDRLFRMVAARILSIDPQARSSMWDDLQRHRPTEIDYLQGAILALAAQTGTAAPLTERIAGLVKEAEAAGAGSPGLQPREIERATS